MKNKLISKKFAPILIILFILLAFFPFYYKNNFLGDLGDPIGQFIPNKILLIEFFKARIFPFINPLSFLGIPFFADMQVASLYFPDNLLFLIFPKYIAYNLSILIHFAFCAVGFYLWINKKTKSPLIALSLASCIVLSAFGLNKIYFINFFEVIAYIPWILFFLSQKKTSTLILSILFSMMILAGHPIAFIYSLMIIIPYSIIIERKKTIKLFFGLAISAFITAIQTIPFLFFVKDSVRNKIDYTTFTEGSLRFKDLINIINPFYLKNENTIEGFIYMGTIPIISLLFIILFRKKIHKTIFYTALSFIFIGIALSRGSNSEILSKILYEIPIINMIRVPARYMILTHFGILMLLMSFFPEFLKKYKKTATTVLIMIILNALIIPSIYLSKIPLSLVENEYKKTSTQIELRKQPEYSVISASTIFPNRHFLNGTHSITGYNPLIPSIFNEQFPMNAVGSFKNPNYIIDYFKKFQKLGVKYYLFPSEKKLQDLNLFEKNYLNEFLKEKTKISISNDLNTNLYIDNESKSFIYFNNPINEILDIKYTPSKIIIKTIVKEDDELIINQLYNKNWKYEETNQTAKINEDIVQKYSITKNTETITIKYHSPFFKTSILLSIMGILILISITIKRKTWNI